MLWDRATCCHHGDQAKGGWCTVGDGGPVPNWSPGLYGPLLPCSLWPCRCTVTFKLIKGKAIKLYIRRTFQNKLTFTHTHT